MKFLHLFDKSPSGFAKIKGYEDIKDTVRRALDSEDNYSLLFICPSASDTLFIGNTRAQTWNVFRWFEYHEQNPG